MLWFYPMSAFICIFWSILQYPLDPISSEDLDLLKGTIGTMDRLLAFMGQGSQFHPSCQNAPVNSKRMMKFMEELHFLGVCAIQKAWGERGGDIDVGGHGTGVRDD